MKCRSCSNINLEVILDLGTQPWCNQLLNKIGEEENTYPLKLVYCGSCELLQLDYTVPKEVMFFNHGYRSGMTETLKKHFFDIAKENIEMFKLDSKDCILDIGGNDGTQLLQYKKLGIDNVINFESAVNISKISSDSGIFTINKFFNEDTVKEHLKPNSIKLINAAGVFFHLEELHSVIRAVQYALTEDGIFNIQCMYANEMIKQGTYDMIYHEHLCYYTLRSLINLLKPYDLNIFDAYHSEIHSGSLIVRVCKGTNHEKTQRFFKMQEEDNKYSINDFKEFASKVHSNKGKLKLFLQDLKNLNKKIYAYGSPAKGNTLLNFEEIDNSLVDKAVEVNELKIGKVLPMSHIPIEKESSEDLPDYYLLLSHNFEKEILQKNKNLLEKNIKFIIPFPHIRII